MHPENSEYQLASEKAACSEVGGGDVSMYLIFVSVAIWASSSLNVGLSPSLYPGPIVLRVGSQALPTLSF